MFVSSVRTILFLPAYDWLGSAGQAGTDLCKTALHKIVPAREGPSHHARRDKVMQTNADVVSLHQFVPADLSV